MTDTDASLAKLLQRADLWRAGRAANEAAGGLPTGQAGLDAALHLGGWPRGMLIELLCELPGSGEMGLLLPSLAHCSREQRWLLLVAPPWQAFAPAWQAAGVDLKRLLLVLPGNRDDLLWCAEQALRSGACSCVLAWLPQHGLRYRDLRRLQLAAQDSDSLAFALRPASAASQLASPAALRLQLQPQASSLAVNILKQRGGPAGQSLRLPRAPQLLAPRIPAARLPVTARATTSPAPLHAGCRPGSAGLAAVTPGNLTLQ